MTPSITSKKIVKKIVSMKTGYEVFDEWPVIKEDVRHGIYVNHPMPVEMWTYSSGFACGNQAHAKDEFKVLLISFQDDVNLAKASDIITDIPYYNDLMSEYHDISYTTERDYLNRAEYRIYTFTCERLDY